MSSSFLAECWVPEKLGTASSAAAASSVVSAFAAVATFAAFGNLVATIAAAMANSLTSASADATAG